MEALIWNTQSANQLYYKSKHPGNRCECISPAKCNKSQLYQTKGKWTRHKDVNTFPAKPCLLSCKNSRFWENVKQQQNIQAVEK